jgi:uncharacterized membrane protein
MIGPRFLRPLAVRPRLMIGLGIGAVVAALLPSSFVWSERWMAGWDAGVLVFLTLLFSSWRKVDAAAMRKRAERDDEGRNVFLFLAIAGVAASIASIANEVARNEYYGPQGKIFGIAFAVGTVGLSWLFIQSFLAQHYAHEYYGAAGEPKEKRGGLHFPGGEAPDYWDFFNFAVTIGAAAQTADVSITSKTMRRLVTWHSLVAYVFNTVILAMAVGAAAGLL